MQKLLTFTIALAVVTACTTVTCAASEADEATREVTLSLKGVTCGSCWTPIEKALSKIDGLISAEFNLENAECILVVGQNVTDSLLVAVVSYTGYSCELGAGKGGYATQLVYPDSADILWLSKQGEKIEDLSAGLAPGKINIVDFYADWCGPCRVLDQTLLKLATTRDDVAIRKVNIVNYKSPVAKQFLRRVRGIPYLLVFDKNGKRIARITGLDIEKLNEALAKAGSS